MDGIIETKKPYVIWEVGGKELKLKLSTSGIIELEGKLGANLLDVVMRTEEGRVPPLKVMLMITHQALQSYEHGYKEKDVINLYEQYLQDGGSQMKFLTDVFLPIYQVSGFFSKAQAEKMGENLLEASEQA